MPAAKGHRLIGVVVRTDQDQKLDALAKREGKTRSSIVQDVLDRRFTIVPDAEIETRKRD